MRKNLTSLCAIFLTYIVGYSQTLTPTVIATTGDYYTASSGSLSVTIGEPVIETTSGSNNYLTQGFQQSNYLVTTITENTSDAVLISAYPNPANNNITVADNSEKSQKLKLEVYDTNGRTIYSETFEKQTQLNLSAYSSGYYFLNVSDENMQVVQKFKIQKTK